jgi:hypothetical protein
LAGYRGRSARFGDLPTDLHRCSPARPPGSSTRAAWSSSSSSSLRPAEHGCITGRGAAQTATPPGPGHGLARGGAAAARKKSERDERIGEVKGRPSLASSVAGRHPGPPPGTLEDVEEECKKRLGEGNSGSEAPATLFLPLSPRTGRWPARPLASYPPAPHTPPRTARPVLFIVEQ